GGEALLCGSRARTRRDPARRGNTRRPDAGPLAARRADRSARDRQAHRRRHGELARCIRSIAHNGRGIDGKDAGNWRGLPVVSRTARAKSRIAVEIAHGAMLLDEGNAWYRVMRP